MTWLPSNYYSTGDQKHLVRSRWRRTLSIISCCIFVFILTSWSHHSDWFAYNDLVSAEYDSDSLRPTAVIGGVPGFYVFEGLWYRNGTFYAFQDSAMVDMRPFPDKDTIMSGPHDIVLRPISTQQQLFRELGGEKRFFPGQTLFLNDGADQWNWSYLNWFYHFAAEVILGGITALSLTSSIEDAKTIPRLLIPWEGNWKDGYGINEAMVSGMFGEDVVEKDQWDRWGEEGNWIGFDKVVIVDRYASHRHNPIANEWNKMALPIFSELPSPPPPFFTPYRETLLHNLDLTITPPRQQYGRSLNKIPKIVYLDRQDTSRKLSEGDHKGLLGVLKELKREGKAVVGVPHLADMGFKDQAKAVKDADIIIGVHGNGLTHQMWMPEGGIVIELFIPDSFLRDYQVLSQALGHRHVATWGDRILPPSEWEHFKGQLNPTILHNGTFIPLDTTFIQTLLEDLIVEMT